MSRFTLSSGLFIYYTRYWSLSTNNICFDVYFTDSCWVKIGKLQLCNERYICFSFIIFPGKTFDNILCFSEDIFVLFTNVAKASPDAFQTFYFYPPVM